MSYIKYFKERKSNETDYQSRSDVSLKTESEHNPCKSDIMNEAKGRPEEILRRAGFKIRLVTPTSFGTQIDFARSYDSSEIEDVLSDFDIKIKDKSVFIVE